MIDIAYAQAVIIIKRWKCPGFEHNLRKKIIKKTLDIFSFKCYTIWELKRDVLVKYALVAQLDRVFDYESKGRGFEPLQARHGKNLGIPIIWGFRGFAVFQNPEMSQKSWKWLEKRSQNRSQKNRLMPGWKSKVWAVFLILFLFPLIVILDLC